MSDAVDNPFAPSTAAASTELQPLFSETACMVTTFFGTPVFAAPLLVANASRTQQSAAGVALQAVGAFVAVLLLGVVDLPVPNVAYTILQVLAVRHIHRTWFSSHIQDRDAQGVPPASWLPAALLCLLGFTASMLFVGLLIGLFGLEGLADL